eukprot:765976-Hanusia_phi.AAC.11
MRRHKTCAVPSITRLSARFNVCRPARHLVHLVGEKFDLVPAQVQVRQRRQAGEGRRKELELVVFKAELLQVGQVADRVGQGLERVPVEQERDDTRQRPDDCWELHEAILPQVEMLEAYNLRDLPRKRPELVVPECQYLKDSQLGDLRGEQLDDVVLPAGEVEDACLVRLVDSAHVVEDLRRRPLHDVLMRTPPQVVVRDDAGQAGDEGELEVHQSQLVVGEVEGGEVGEEEKVCRDECDVVVRDVQPLEQQQAGDRKVARLHWSTDRP